MKKFISLVVAVLLLTTLFAGCGKTGQSNDQPTSTGSAAGQTTEAATESTPKLSGKIVFATGRTDKADNVITDLAKEFMAANPGTEVSVEAIKDLSTIKTRMAANELPDTFILPGDIAPKDYPAFCEPIDDLGFNKDTMYFLDKGKGEDGKLYAIPDGMYVNGVIYIKKTFADAGITSIPKTLDEFWAACETLKSKGIIPFATNFKEKWPLTHFVGGAYQNDVYSSKLYLNRFAEMDVTFDEGMLAGLNILRTMKEKGYTEPDLVSTNWDGNKRDMVAGKIAMTYLGDWYVQNLIDNGGTLDDIGMFPFPGAKSLVSSSGNYYAVAKSSKSIDAAKAFYKFLFGEGRLQLECGSTPANIGIETLTPYLEELLGAGVPVLEGEGLTADYLDIYNKAQIDFGTIAQEYMLAKDQAEVDGIVSKYNKTWADAKKAVGK